MALLRSRRLRRLVALGFTFCLAIGEVEVPIADVHDGHASQAEIDFATGAAPGHHVSAEVDLAPDAPATDDAEHPAHVCHCAHAHGGMLATVELDLRIPDGSVPATRNILDPHVSVTLDPPDHPPLT